MVPRPSSSLTRIGVCGWTVSLSLVATITSPRLTLRIHRSKTRTADFQLTLSLKRIVARADILHHRAELLRFRRVIRTLGGLDRIAFLDGVVGQRGE